MLPGQSWGKGPGTAPSCVSPNQPPSASPSAAPSLPIPEMGEQTLRTRCLCEAEGSRRCCAEAHCAPPPGRTPACPPTFVLPLPLSWDVREEAEEPFFTFYTHLHMLTLGSPVHRLCRVSHTLAGGLDPEPWGSPAAWGLSQEERPPEPSPPLLPPQDLRGAKSMRKPHSSSVNLES